MGCFRSRTVQARGMTKERRRAGEVELEVPGRDRARRDQRHPRDDGPSREGPWRRGLGLTGLSCRSKEILVLCQKPASDRKDSDSWPLNRSPLTCPDNQELPHLTVRSTQRWRISSTTPSTARRLLERRTAVRLDRSSNWSRSSSVQVRSVLTCIESSSTHPLIV